MDKENGWTKCYYFSKTDKPCRICPYTFENTDNLTTKVTNTKHIIKGNLNCKTTMESIIL